MPDYTYEPLPSEPGHFRLLRLRLNSNDTEIVQCEMFSARLEDQPQYTALSYCWGSPDTPHQISIEGQSLVVTTSLRDALRQLRHQAPLVLWVDAVCINQQDPVERGSQVAQMREIYRSAEKVDCWLGMSSDGSDEAVDWIRRFGRWGKEIGVGTKKELYLRNLLELWDRDGEASRLPAETQSFLRGLYQSLDISTTSHETSNLANQLADFMDRQYWKRLWVVQEVFNGKHVEFLCGDDSIEEEDLDSALRILRNLQYYRRIKKYHFLDFDKLDTFNAVTMLKMRRAGQKGVLLPLVYLLRSFRRSACGLRVDRIFALQGLAADADELGIIPDYTMAEREVFLRVARALLRSGYIEVMSLCNSTQRMTGLPSWVPDWHAYGSQSLLQQRAIIRSELVPTSSTEVQPSFRACGNLPLTMPVKFEEDEDTLTIAGVHVGRMEAVGPARETVGIDMWLKWLVGYSGDTSSCESTCRLEACVTAIADQHVRDGPKKQRSNPIVLQQVCDSLQIWPGDIVTHLRDNGLSDYCEQLSQVSVCRKPFKVAGHIGIGPDQVELGDEVHVVSGCPVPLIFRPLIGTQNVRLIGEAYIHGLMDGEAVRDDEPLTMLHIV